MSYEFIITKGERYFKSGICTELFKEIFEKIIEYDIIRENVKIDFKDLKKKQEDEK